MVSFGVTVNFIHRSKVGLAFHKQARLTAGVRGYKVGGGGMVEVFFREVWSAHFLSPFSLLLSCQDGEASPG